MRAVGNPYLLANMGRERYGLPSLENLIAIADAIGLELYFGPAREAGTVEQLAVGEKDYAPIPLHEAELAAGDGRNNGTEEIIEHLAFRKDWLARIGVAASKARLARVRGDSMLPTLHDHDLVMIDTSKISVPCRPRKAGKPVRADLYAFLEDGEAKIKRIEHSEFGTIVIHSDNFSLFSPKTLTGPAAHRFEVIGKVIWWGHTVKE